MNLDATIWVEPYYDGGNRREIEFASSMEWANEHCIRYVRGDIADDLLAALEAVEWVQDRTWGKMCPWCGGLLRDGHAPDCQRQAALARVRE